eukprot:1670913-Pyramimonas_sp.AAC.1
MDMESDRSDRNEPLGALQKTQRACWKGLVQEAGTHSREGPVPCSQASRTLFGGPRRGQDGF